MPVFFAAGEEALCREASTLTPGVVTAGVKRGLLQDGLDHLSFEEYSKAKLAAIHLSPGKACELIRLRAKAAADLLRSNRDQFHIPKVHLPIG